MFAGSTGESGVAIENTFCVLPAFSDLEKRWGFFCPLHSYQNIRFSFFVLFCSQSLAPAGGVF